MRFYIILVLSLFILVGCRSAPSIIKTQTLDAKPVEVSTQVQHRKVQKITETATAVEVKVPEVKPEMTEIKVAATEIDEEVKKINDYFKTLVNQANSQTTSLVVENTKLKKENVELKDKTMVQQKKIISLIVIASGLWVGVSGVLFLLGKLPSATLTIIGGAVLLSAITLQFITAYAMYIGAAAVTLLVMFLIYYVFVQKRTLVETVYTAEEAKKQIGNVEFAKIAEEQQSPTSVKLIKQIRDKEGLSTDSKEK